MSLKGNKINNWLMASCIVAVLVCAVPMFIGFAIQNQLRSALQHFQAAGFTTTWQYQRGWFSSRWQMQLTPTNRFTSNFPLLIESRVQHGPVLQKTLGQQKNWFVGLFTATANIFWQQQLLQYAFMESSFAGDTVIELQGQPYQGVLYWFDRPHQVSWQGISGQIKLQAKSARHSGRLQLLSQVWQQEQMQRVDIGTTNLQWHGQLNGEGLEELSLMTEAIQMQRPEAKRHVNLTGLSFSYQEKVDDSSDQSVFGLMWAALQTSGQNLGPLDLKFTLDQSQAGWWPALQSSVHDLSTNFSLQAVGEKIKELADALPQLQLQASLQTKQGKFALQGQAKANTESLLSSSMARFAPTLWLLQLFHGELELDAPQLALERLLDDVAHWDVLPYFSASQVRFIYDQLLLRRALRNDNGRIYADLALVNGNATLNGKALLPLSLAIGAAMLVQPQQPQ